MSGPTVNLSFPNGGKSSFPGGLFINNKFVPAQDGKVSERASERASRQARGRAVLRRRWSAEPFRHSLLTLYACFSSAPRHLPS